MKQFHRQKGQGLVEFAIVLPLFVIMMVGIFMVAVYCYNIMAVSTMARDTARQLILCKTSSEVKTKKSTIEEHYNNSTSTKPILYSWDKNIIDDSENGNEYITVTIKANNDLNLTIPGLPDTIAKSETMYWEGKSNS